MPYLSWVETGLKTNNFPIFFQQKHEFLSLFFLSTCASKHSATLRAVCASLLPLTQSNPCLIHFARNRSLMFDSDSFPSPLLHSGFFSFVETLLPYFSGYTMWKLAENQAQLEFRTDFLCEFKRCQHWGSVSCSHTAWHKQGKPQWQLRTHSNIV